MLSILLELLASRIESIRPCYTSCAGYLAHPFAKSVVFYERMCQVASTGVYNKATGYTPDVRWIRLTTYGEQFYRENWARYRELYPAIAAPDPDVYQV